MVSTPGRMACLALLVCFGLLSAADYRIQVTQQEFTLPAGTTMEQIAAGEVPLGDLKAGDVLFLHEVTVAEEQILANTVKIGRTKVEVRYQVGKAVEKALPVGVSISVNEAGETPDDVSPCWSCQTSLLIPIGQDTLLIWGGPPEGGRTRLTIIRVDGVQE